MSFTRTFFNRSEKSIVGIPLNMDQRMSPYLISRSISVAPSEGPGLLPPKSLSFHETPLTRCISTSLFSVESFPTSLNLTFIVLRSPLKSFNINVTFIITLFFLSKIDQSR
ncbi:hypothetical protein ES288_A03G070100v1 [Gossypium darwinii]|uniref:Uncharacterized protein n=1 Tax=Gossypium darwinii TaxID=34276 RepID=A0A5D2H196_GOSDA|nr:hypothetical protein ES288_A03G070100v1 [Gossypium darwinii]